MVVLTDTNRQRAGFNLFRCFEMLCPLESSTWTLRYQDMLPLFFSDTVHTWTFWGYRPWTVLHVIVTVRSVRSPLHLVPGSSRAREPTLPVQASSNSLLLCNRRHTGCGLCPLSGLKSTPPHLSPSRVTVVCNNKGDRLYRNRVMFTYNRLHLRVTLF